MNELKNIKIAVVGDVHDLWNEYDLEALHFLNIDLVLFVGDFGNESLHIVKNIAEVDLPKATIMGNHDAWFSATNWGRARAPYDHNLEDRVQAQLDLLGSSHVGYECLDFPQFALSIVGSRPFSWGGDTWRNKEFYAQRYAVNNFAESTAKIMTAVEKTSFNDLILIGHNGPFGLGANPEDTCGRDWQPLGGDFGDPDFKNAIDLTHQNGKKISLVTFGHMHHPLRHTKDRLRTIINQDSHGTIYLNAAATPRIEKREGDNIHKFAIVDFVEGEIETIELISINEKMSITNQEQIFSSSVSQV